jgi:hypothetical protein
LNANVNIYTARNWRIYTVGNNNSYADAYNQVLLEAPDDSCNEHKQYYKKIFEREFREVQRSWKEEGANNEYSEEMEDKY